MSSDLLKYSPMKNGAETQTRTADLLFTKQLLYRLSYPGARGIIGRSSLLNVRSSRELFPWFVDITTHESTKMNGICRKLVTKYIAKSRTRQRTH